MHELLRLIINAFAPGHRFGAEDLLAAADEQPELAREMEKRFGLRMEFIQPTHAAQALRECLGREHAGMWLMPRGEGLYEVREGAEEAS